MYGLLHWLGCIFERQSERLEKLFLPVLYGHAFHLLLQHSTRAKCLVIAKIFNTYSVYESNGGVPEGENNETMRANSVLLGSFILISVTLILRYQWGIPLPAKLPLLTHIGLKYTRILGRQFPHRSSLSWGHTLSYLNIDFVRSQVGNVSHV